MADLLMCLISHFSRTELLVKWRVFVCLQPRRQHVDAMLVIF